MIITVTPNTLLEYQLESNFNLVGESRLSHIPYVVGGKGVNMARMLKSLGLNPLAMTFAGGLNGEKIIESLKKEKLNLKIVKTLSETRVGISLLENAGEKHRWWLEEGRELIEAEVKEMISLLQKKVTEKTILILAGSIPGVEHQDLYLRILESLKVKPLKIFVDACGVPLSKACKVGGFFLKHNRKETLNTFGLDPFNSLELDAYLEKLKTHKIWGALITNGAKESILWDGTKLYGLVPPTLKKVSIVGCGDATLAGLVYGISQGQNLLQASTWGLACGSADVKYHGPCQATISDAKALLHKVTVKD